MDNQELKEHQDSQALLVNQDHLDHQDLMGNPDHKEHQENQVNQENQEIKEHEVNELGGGECCLLVLFNFLFLICIYPLCWGFYTVEPLQAVVIMFLGKVIKVTKTPGLKWFWPIGREVKTVSLAKPSIFFYIFILEKPHFRVSRSSDP